MRFFGSQKARKKRTASVGIAEENDLGSFSGLEVAIDNDETKRFSADRDERTTTKEEKLSKKQQQQRPKIYRGHRTKFFFRSSRDKPPSNCKRNSTITAAAAAIAISHQKHDNNSNSNTSNDLSVYTSNCNSSNPLDPTRTHEGFASFRKATSSGDGFVVKLDHVSDLILDLDTAVIVGAKRSIRALKMLLTLSSLSSPSPPSSATDPSAAAAAAFSNNNNESIHGIRIQMVRSDNERLVPVLLTFLNRCMVQSKEHTLALLVLCNLSIPQENKKLIALDCKGAEILARLLCEDPSSYLVALVLVNLTYDSSSESKTTTAIEVTAVGTNSSNNNNTIDVIHPDHHGRQSEGVDRSSPNKELLATNGKTALVESLAFALRVSSLTQDEYERRRDTIEDCNFSDEYTSPATRLSILMAKDQQLRSSEMEAAATVGLRKGRLHRNNFLPATASPEQILQQLRSNEEELQQWGCIDGAIVVADETNLVARQNKNTARPSPHSNTHHQLQLHPPPMVETSKQIYPETAKWCLSALRNLTKPLNCDATAAHVLIKSGVFSLVVQCITTLGSGSSRSTSTSINTSINASTSGASTKKVARMGVSQLEKPSSPCPPAKNSISTASIASGVQQQLIDNNFLSASYGQMRSQNVVSPHLIAGAVANDGDGAKVHSVSQNREPRTLPLLIPSINSPYSWESNSMQDAALSIVLNASASSKSREYMNEPHIVKVLTMIAEYPRLMRKMRKKAQTIAQEDRETMNFQALKARIAISYLVGSEGHFGQTKLRSSASTLQANRADSSLVMSDSDVELLVELMANTINHRGKDGNGGGNYLSGTFDLKRIILSLRCLLTHTSNQKKIAELLGSELNALLINTLARYSLEPLTSPIDAESSGHLVFSMYLLSNHCFIDLPFLPGIYGTPKQQHRDRHHCSSTKASMDEEEHGLAANIFVSYLRLSSIPPEGRHAAQQLLLRLEYLNFENCTAADSGMHRRRTLQNVVRSADLKINYILLAKIKRVRIANRKHGSKPDPAIFHRPVLRCQKPYNWDENQKHQKKIDWSNPFMVPVFENALIAVQQLSYGSIKVRRSISGSIDDVAIANKIARCASHETPGGCHNFLWAWKIVNLEKNCGRSNSVAVSDFNALCQAEFQNSQERFSLLQLCCSSDSAESADSEV